MMDLNNHPTATLSPERIEALRRLEAEVEAARGRLAAYRQDCLVEAPVKPGDEIVIRGFAHTGKKMRVTRVSLSAGYSGNLKWKATGNVLKKDGTDSLHTAETYWDIEE